MPSSERLKAQELFDAARRRLPDLHAEQMKRLVAEVIPKLSRCAAAGSALLPSCFPAKKGMAGASNF
jgi:hypothetical protein